jgi:hypothetical protein
MGDHDLQYSEIVFGAFPLLYPPPQAGEEKRKALEMNVVFCIA